MKNKRWKREAKRMIGHCKRLSCKKCSSKETCCKVSISKAPWTFNYRELEQLCKGK